MSEDARWLAHGDQHVAQAAECYEHGLPPGSDVGAHLLAEAQRRCWHPVFELEHYDSIERGDELRRMPYDEYLLSPEWRRFRQTVLQRFDSRCAVCNSDQNLQVHHRTYANRGEERLNDLVALCADCHRRFHSAGRVRFHERIATRAGHR